MEQFYSSVSPKGQVTVPLKIRKMLGLRVKDQVQFEIVGGRIVLSRVDSQLANIHQSVPALPRLMSDKEMAEIAWEDYAEEVAREGLEDN